MDDFLTGSPRNVEHLIGRAAFRLVECDLTGFVHVPGDVDLAGEPGAGASPIRRAEIP
ncbi:hypothetical protein [Streptosporangium roseum]|uniref:hypothetical protein n=1 Tax=Streptosporangium roseum TaxID=2001 RepID=UPI003D9FB061